MDEHFSIMIKENDTTTLKLLTEKLNDGFYVNERIEVGRSTIIVLRKAGERRNRRGSNLTQGLDMVTGMDQETETVPGSLTSRGI